MTRIISIRPSTRLDLPGLVALQHASSPMHPWTPGELERDLERLEPRLQHHFLVAEAGGDLLGMAHFQRPAGSYAPGRFQLQVCVAPSRQGAGVGRALYDAALVELTAMGADTLLAQVRESDPRAMRFAADRGFTEAKRDFESCLDLVAFDAGPFLPHIERLRGDGVMLRTFRDLDTAAFRQDFHRVFEEVRVDVPRVEPPTPLTFTFFEENVLDDPDMLPEAFVFALEGGCILGFTGGYRGALPGCLDTWLTAVVRQARGRHLATALKVQSMLNARGLGLTMVRTDNDTRNAPMLAVNDRLGFRRQPAVILLRKPLAGAAEA